MSGGQVPGAPPVQASPMMMIGRSQSPPIVYIVILGAVIGGFIVVGLLGAKFLEQRQANGPKDPLRDIVHDPETQEAADFGAQAADAEMPPQSNPYRDERQRIAFFVGYLEEFKGTVHHPPPRRPERRPRGTSYPPADSDSQQPIGSSGPTLGIKPVPQQSATK